MYIYIYMWRVRGIGQESTPLDRFLCAFTFCCHHTHHIQSCFFSWPLCSLYICIHTHMYVHIYHSTWSLYYSFYFFFVHSFYSLLYDISTSFIFFFLFFFFFFYFILLHSMQSTKTWQCVHISILICMCVYYM